MCYGCWEEAGKPKIDNERVQRAIASVKALYEVHGAGGCMHIVTDDWNCEDGNVAWCREWMASGDVQKLWQRDPDALEMECLAAFEALSEDERYSALAIESGFTD